MKINPKKILLGTANFKTKYGFKSTFINKKKSIEILNYALKKNISGIDISTNYMITNDLKKINQKKFPFISLKFTERKLKKINSKNDLMLFLKPFLSLSKKQKIDCILFHRAKDLFTKRGVTIYKILRHLKKNKKISKIGVSIYDLKEIKKILKKYKIDVLQIPFNVLDQRLLNSNFLGLLKRRKIEIHARSIFLQGLTLNENLAPTKLKKSKDLKKWFFYLKDNKFDPLSENLNFINRHKFIKKIIVGVRSKDHLNKILKKNIIVKKNYDKFNSLNLKLIDPRKW